MGRARDGWGRQDMAQGTRGQTQHSAVHSSGTAAVGTGNSRDDGLGLGLLGIGEYGRFFSSTYFKPRRRNSRSNVSAVG